MSNATNFRAQLAVFTTQLELLESHLNTKQVLVCGLCQEDHHINQCSFTTESINFVRSFEGKANQVEVEATK